ncbi:hypothetical protein I547_3675 [Mycobacterium kansasii 824]|nr:hypothetical protein I547_3675 [Mycobacterium kansasii 824]
MLRTTVDAEAVDPPRSPLVQCSVGQVVVRSDPCGGAGLRCRPERTTTPKP